MKASEISKTDGTGSESLRLAACADLRLGLKSSRDASTVGLVAHSLRALFVIVAVLLLADLHSSYVAAHSQWEMNPFLEALAEHVGTRAALVSAEVVDLAMLAGLLCTVDAFEGPSRRDSRAGDRGL